MKKVLRRDAGEQQTGYLGTTKVPLNQFDVSTQADIQHQTLTGGSEDEIMGRLYGNDKRTESNPVAHYSKQDILEQYCISERGLGNLENGGHGFFGCLPSHQCSAKTASSFLTSCVRQKVASDENLYDLYKRRDYAPYPKRHRYPWSPVSSDVYAHDQDLRSLYFRRKPCTDPGRYTWMPSDDESVKMEKPKSILDLSYKNQLTASKKHVSFARSHTLTSFDDAMSSLSSSSSHLNRITRSQERLLEVRNPTITKQPELSDKLLDKVKRGPMKTQATQTDTIRKNLNLSPRTAQRVKMVSQAAQTNGINGRKLIKSLSEANSKFPLTEEDDPTHEPLCRTQSDEPPRSPFFTTLPPPDIPSETSSLSQQSEDSVDPKKEIFIDFKPAGKRPLVKTASDGVILKPQSDDGIVPSYSISHENLNLDDQRQEFTPYFQKSPIKNEGICRPLDRNIYSLEGSLQQQDSVDEEFHENIVYSRDLVNEVSPIDESVVPSIYLRPELKLSPFASNDSLTTEARDQSDEIWNESQVTVVQIDSGTDNEALPASARRKHLLMIHQQRSSFDTDELLEPDCPKIIVDKPCKLEVPSRHPMRASPLPAIVPDLARTDSSKTNQTDLSESTTTDDYITANSDSSRPYQTICGSSFDSAKGSLDTVDDMVVPSLSPRCHTPVPQIRTGRSTPTDDSSSCGSYSVGNSTPDLLDRYTKVWSDDEERSVQYSSSGYYESPVEDSTKHEVQPKKISPPKETLKPKRSKRTRSPMQGKKGRKDNKATSDESSTGREYTLSQNSPRKVKKSKDNSRRKSLPRSPTGQKGQKKEEFQPQSLPGSLNRRKSVKAEKKCKEKSPTSTLKALSAESLRSVSPGSDSVFYSDPSAMEQVHCLHCGKEVHAQDHQNHVTHDIVQPPAGFEDSPKPKGRMFKKLDKRLKSEDKGEHRRHRYRPDLRAKSEERGGASTTTSRRGRLRPMQRSPHCSKEHLKAADSSPSILPGAPEEDNDQGVYAAHYASSKWLCVHDHGDEPRSSLPSTESEHDLCKRFQTITHRIRHRKPYVDMYKRLHFKTFECDQTITVQRDSGEFGFRIHGSKPVVVTAIESGTPAESSGLQVGDIILSVNGINVLDRSHSDVVQIAHAGSDTLTLGVARTSYALTNDYKVESATVHCGYLWKLSGHAKGSTGNKWTRRWFSLKKNNCLYYYKSDCEKQPVGVVMLFDQKVTELDGDSEPIRQHKFVIHRDDSVPLYLAADSLDGRSEWIDLLEKCVNECQQVDEFLEDTKRNLTLPATSITDPDCFGFLIKLGTQWKSWSRRYCVLKDAALYFYHDSNAPHAFGVALLHGYKVQQTSTSKKHAFEIVPADPAKKHYYFHAESDTDRRRWISALEYSIDRWLKLQ